MAALFEKQESFSCGECGGNSFGLVTKIPVAGSVTLAFSAAQLKEIDALARHSPFIIVSMTEDALKKAREAAQIMKDALGGKELSATTETTQEMEAGSPRTPGYEPAYGQTMKEQPTEAKPANSQVSEFDKALEAIQKQGQEQGKGKDLEH